MTSRNLTDPLAIVGTTVGEKYHIDEVVGEGGFSLVYRAQHLIWKQPVAIKVFKLLANAPADQREKLLEGFVQEGKLMTELSSRSAAIVQARDIGTFITPRGDWVPYMVLEWLAGQPLDGLLHDEAGRAAPPRSLQEAMILLESAAVAIEVAHSKGVAHRDLKPANFFVMSDTSTTGAMVKVLDFGIAKVMAEHAHVATALSNTGTEVTSFTPNYGAPEQFSRSHGATGPWTDVFAMALVLIEVMRGGVPALQGDDYLQLAVASRDPQTRPTPRLFGLAVPDAVEAVFHHALAVSPTDRYKTMGEFWRELHRVAFPGQAVWAPTGLASTGQAMWTPPSVPGGAPSSMSASAPFGGARSGTVPIDLATAPGGPAVMSTGPASVVAAPLAGGKGRGVLIAGGLAGVAVAVGATFLLMSRAAPPESEAEGPATSTEVSPSATTSAAAMPPCPATMVLVQGGKFFRGSDDDSFPLWHPSHKVTLRPYCIDKHEVTAAQYKACSDVGDCKRPHEKPIYPKTKGTTDADHERKQEIFSELCTFGKDGLASHPINCVTWKMADNYCRVAGGRLPTEAEWEFAARGSDGRKFPWGDDPGDERFMNACGTECNAWEEAHGVELTPRMYEKDDGFPGTAPVGSYPKGTTAFGLDDMVGNVWEWTSDWFGDYSSEDQDNPGGPATGERKVIRGGGFNGGVALWLNPAFRYHQDAGASSHAIGFRCAADPANK